MECKICLETFDNFHRRAMILECGHSFCKTCIQSLYAKEKVICPIDRSYLSSSLKSVKINYSLDEIIQAIASLKIKIPSEGEKIVRPSEKIESLEKTESNPKAQAKAPKIKIQPQEALCPERHALIFFSNYRDRNKVADNPKRTKIICNICKSKKIRTCWTCITCDYDLCELCFSQSFGSIQYSNINENPEILCFRNHKLVNYNLIQDRIKSAKLPSETVILCYLCKIQISISCSTCITCNFDLCQECSLEQIHSIKAVDIPNTLCVNFHPLYYYQDNSRFFFRKEGPILFSCNNCEEDFADGSWGCRICNIYLCNDCACSNLKPVILKCDKNHSLKKLGSGVSKIKCSLCNCVEKCSHNCSGCNYNLCENCIEYVEKRVFKPFNCPLGHNLAFSENFTDLCHRMNMVNQFKCNACKVSFLDTNWYYCNQCEFKLCQGCFESVNNGITKGIDKKCKNNHELRWYDDTCIYYGRYYKCNNCRHKFKNCGSFHCRSCKLDICVECCKSFLVS